MASDLEEKPPICGKNVGSWPVMPLFEARKKSSKEIAISKFPVWYVDRKKKKDENKLLPVALSR